MTYNVHSRIGRDVTHAREDERHVQLPDSGLGECAGKTVDDERKEETHDPEVLELAVDGIAGEHVLGTNGTPND